MCKKKPKEEHLGQLEPYDGKFDKSQIHHFVVQTFGCGSNGTFTKSPSNFHEILSLIENSMTLFLISCTNIPKTVILKMIQRENLVWTRKRAIALFNLEKPHFERNVWVKSDAKPKGTLAVPKRFAGTSKESSCQSNCSNKLSAQIFRI